MGEPAPAGADRTVILGNRKAIEVVPDPDNPGERTRRRVTGNRKRYTRIVIPPQTGLLEGVRNIMAAWAQMSDAPAPAWIASSDPATAQILAQEWGGVEIRDLGVNNPTSADTTDDAEQQEEE